MSLKPSQLSRSVLHALFLIPTLRCSADPAQLHWRSLCNCDKVPPRLPSLLTREKSGRHLLLL